MKSQDQKLCFSLRQQRPVGYEEAAVQWLKAGSGWVGGSRGEGLAGAGWHAATPRAACSWEECSLLKAESSFSQSQCISWGIKMYMYPTNATLSTLQSEEEYRHRLEGGKEAGAQPFLRQ